jgi:hypothetical protein
MVRCTETQALSRSPIRALSGLHHKNWLIITQGWIVLYHMRNQFPAKKGNTKINHMPRDTEHRNLSKYQLGFHRETLSHCHAHIKLSG